MTLKELLGEELYNQVMEKVGDKHKIAIVSDGNWIPKDKFDAVNNEKNEYKQQVESLNQKLTELDGKLKDNEEAQQTIEALKQQIEDKEQELAQTRKINAIKFEILKANPRDVADILPHIDSDVVKIEDGKVLGLEEQIKALKESKAYLFNDEEPSGTGGSKGNAPRSASRNIITKEDFSKMNYLERLKLKQENEELYNQLIKER